MKRWIVSQPDGFVEIGKIGYSEWIRIDDEVWIGKELVWDGKNTLLKSWGWCIEFCVDEHLNHFIIFERGSDVECVYKLEKVVKLSHKEI